MEEAPHPPAPADRSPAAMYNEQLRQFKTGLLDHLDPWEKMALKAASGLAEYRLMMQTARFTEIVNLYLKRIAE